VAVTVALLAPVVLVENVMVWLLPEARAASVPEPLPVAEPVEA
jgi:hypothetical protein